ncbi:MAG: PorT family protein [Bacteroidetes bacterium]|nr:PorT family protein [Bacteroidota bacterium]MBU1718792.1 PorT family protein [Bacteroidota bacterium]
MYRKIIAVFSVVSCLMFHFAGAQGFKGGFSAGINLSQVFGDANIGYNKAGVNGGIFTTRKFSDRFSGLMELKFSQKGSRKNVNPDHGDYTFWVLRLNYVEMPLTLRFYWTSKIIPEAGFGFGALTGKSYDANGVGVPQQIFADNYRDFEFFIHAGGTYMLHEHWFASFRVALSAASIRKEHIPGFNWLNFRRYGMYNKVVSVFVAYQF